MPSPGQHSDALRLQHAGVDVQSFRTVGAIFGVLVIAAAGNAPGTGLLIVTPAGLSWQAPGSATPGPVVPINGDTQYMLEDGADPTAWLRVFVYQSRLIGAGSVAVDLGDTYNALGPDDVSAANAAAGIVETVQYSLKNISVAAVTSVLAWLDPATAHVAISSDGANFFSPTSNTDPAALSWSSIAAGASVSLWLRRTISAGAASNPRILNTVRLAWTGV